MAERKMRRTGSPSSCPALLCPLFPLSHFRVWVTVWVKNFWPTHKVTFCNKKSPKTEVFGDFWSCYPDSNWGPHPYQSIEQTVLLWIERSFLLKAHYFEHLCVAPFCMTGIYLHLNTVSAHATFSMRISMGAS